MSTLRSDDEAARAKAFLDHFLDSLDFGAQLSASSVKIARAVTRAFIMLDDQRPQLSVEVMMRSQTTFTLTFNGYLSEIDLAIIHDSFLDANRHGFEYIDGVTWNPHAGTITVTINAALSMTPPTRSADISNPKRLQRQELGEANPYRGATQQQRSIVSGGGERIRVNAETELDMSRVEEAHKTSVAEVGVGVLYYDKVMPVVKRRPLVEPLEKFHKLIFFDLAKEFDLKTMYRRMLGAAGQRDDYFTIVRNVGLEPRNNTLVVRINKRQRVHEVR